MKQVELYAKVRYAVQIEGLSERAAARRFGIDPRTVAQDDDVLGAAGLRAHEAAGAAEAGCVHRDHRQHPERRQSRARRSSSTRRSGSSSGCGTSTASRAASRS